MKAIMGFGFFLLFLAGIALVMLQGREMARQNLPGGGAGITGQQWRPVIIGADEVPADSGLFVVFAVDGSINGNGGCNNFVGSFESGDDGVSVGPLASTRMACPEEIMNRDDAFTRAISEVHHFEVRSNSLQLLSADNLLLAELVAAD